MKTNLIKIFVSIFLGILWFLYAAGRQYALKFPFNQRDLLDGIILAPNELVKIFYTLFPTLEYNKASDPLWQEKSGYALIIGGVSYLLAAFIVVFILVEIIKIVKKNIKVLPA